jgi:NAD(P)-dependent dehydrogenase (short-subunit alcohol dehydrogenase family)
MTNSGIIDLRGKTALVTGATRGIGRATALGLAQAGANIIVHGPCESDELDDALNAIRMVGGAVEKLIFDLADTEMISRCLSTYKNPIDIVILNASVETRESIHTIDHSNALHQFTCNFLSMLEIVKHVTPLMCASGWGRIIGIGSIQEVHVNPDLSVYAALKAAQTHFLKTLATQVAKSGVTVNIVAPGAILTDRNREVLSDSAFRAAVEAKIPAGRIGEPEDCVGATIFLASDAANYITGAWLPVDGGFHSL